jgi:integrase
MGRRMKGDGSFFQRKDGMWIGRVELPKSRSGTRRYRYVSSMDRNAAIAKLKKVRKEVDDGTLVATGNTTLEKWLNRWIEEIHAPRGIRPNTLDDYRGIISRHIIPAIGSKRLDKLTPDHVRDLHKFIGASRTAEVAHVVLQKALKDAVREGAAARNVAELVDKPIYKKRKRTSLSPEVVKRVLQAAVSSCDESQAARWAAAFFTGARQGELLGMTWDRVDLTNGLMDISWQLQTHKQVHGCEEPCGKASNRCPQRKWDLPSNFEYELCEGSLLWTRPKTEAGIREIPIVAPLLGTLKNMHANQGPNPHNLVWHDNGKPIKSRTDYQRWRDLLRAAGVIAKDESLPLHSARHTAATLLRAAGVDEQSRMELFGHASTDSQRVYAHADRARHQIAMANLNELLAPQELD